VPKHYEKLCEFVKVTAKILSVPFFFRTRCSIRENDCRLGAAIAHHRLLEKRSQSSTVRNARLYTVIVETDNHSSCQLRRTQSQSKYAAADCLKVDNLVKTVDKEYCNGDAVN